MAQRKDKRYLTNGTFSIMKWSVIEFVLNEGCVGLCLESATDANMFDSSIMLGNMLPESVVVVALEYLQQY